VVLPQPPTPRINKHRPLGRLTTCPAKKKKKKKGRTINNELKTSTQQRCIVAESTLEKGWSKELISVRTISK
jgi:hypothetical protein